MTLDFQLQAIQKEVNFQFHPKSPIAKAIAAKLSLSLYRERRLEHLLQQATAIPPYKLNTLSPLERATFQDSLNSIQSRLKELRRSTISYSAALTARHSKVCTAKESV